MFGKYQAVFRSRWRALWWSAGVLLTAYCTVPSEDGQDPALEMAEMAAEHMAPEKHPPKHVNPWALDKHAPAG